MDRCCDGRSDHVGLFNIGKSLIAWYIGSSAVASSYGAAGGLIVLLLWVYYSAQIFLLGAEFTKIYANRHGSKQRKPVSKKRTAVEADKLSKSRTAERDSAGNLKVDRAF